MDFLMITDENKLHYVYIKDFNGFMCQRQKMIIKNTFTNVFYNVLLVKKSCKNIERYVDK